MKKSIEEIVEILKDNAIGVMKRNKVSVFLYILGISIILLMLAIQDYNDPHYTKTDYFAVDIFIEDGAELSDGMLERYDTDGDGALTHNDALEIRDILKRKGKW